MQILKCKGSKYVILNLTYNDSKRCVTLTIPDMAVSTLFTTLAIFPRRQ